MLFEFQLAVQLAELLFQRARHAGVGSFGLGEIDVELGLELCHRWMGVVWEADGQRVIEEKSTGYGMLGAKGAKSGESRSRAAGDRGAIACEVKLARGTRGVGVDACARRIRAWIS